MIKQCVTSSQNTDLVDPKHAKFHIIHESRDHYYNHSNPGASRCSKARDKQTKYKDAVSACLTWHVNNDEESPCPMRHLRQELP